MQIALWDLDNCLANDEWRIRLIDWAQTNPDKRYGLYHMRCGEDQPANTDLFAAVSGRAAPVFCTARPESVRNTTERWLRRHLPMWSPYPFTLRMRETGEHLPSAQLKRRMAQRLQEAGHTIVAAFDDRQDVVDMYRSLGIDAARLWIHNTCAMTPPMRELAHV